MLYVIIQHPLAVEPHNRSIPTIFSKIIIIVSPKQFTAIDMDILYIQANASLNNCFHHLPQILFCFKSYTRDIWQSNISIFYRNVISKAAKRLKYPWIAFISAKEKA